MPLDKFGKTDEELRQQFEDLMQLDAKYHPIINHLEKLMVQADFLEMLDEEIHKFTQKAVDRIVDNRATKFAEIVLLEDMEGFKGCLVSRLMGIYARKLRDYVNNSDALYENLIDKNALVIKMLKAQGDLVKQTCNRNGWTENDYRVMKTIEDKIAELEKQQADELRGKLTEREQEPSKDVEDPEDKQGRQEFDKAMADYSSKSEVDKMKRKVTDLTDMMLRKRNKIGEA